jgi:hypothetical protein
MPRQCETQRGAEGAASRWTYVHCQVLERSITSGSELVVGRQADYSVINNRHARRTGWLTSNPRAVIDETHLSGSTRVFARKRSQARELVGQNCTRV